MALVRTDLDRITALVDKTKRVLTLEEARTVASYMRALADIAESRRKAGKEKYGGKSMEELVAAVSKIPELREAIASLGVVDA